MSPETFLALATLGSLAFTFTVGFLAGRAWATWRGRSLAAQVSAGHQATSRPNPVLQQANHP